MLEFSFAVDTEEGESGRWVSAMPELPRGDFMILRGLFAVSSLRLVTGHFNARTRKHIRPDLAELSNFTTPM